MCSNEVYVKLVQKNAPQFLSIFLTLHLPNDCIQILDSQWMMSFLHKYESMLCDVKIQSMTSQSWMRKFFQFFTILSLWYFPTTRRHFWKQFWFPILCMSALGVRVEPSFWWWVDVSPEFIVPTWFAGIFSQKISCFLQQIVPHPYSWFLLINGSPRGFLWPWFFVIFPGKTCVQ